MAKGEGTAGRATGEERVRPGMVLKTGDRLYYSGLKNGKREWQPVKVIDLNETGYLIRDMRKGLAPPTGGTMRLQERWFTRTEIFNLMKSELLVKGAKPKTAPAPRPTF